MRAWKTALIKQILFPFRSGRIFVRSFGGDAGTTASVFGINLVVSLVDELPC